MRYSIIDVGLAFAAGIGISLALPALDPRAVFLAAAGTAIIAVLGVHWRRGFLVLLLVAVALLGGLREQTTRLPLSRLYALAPSLRAVEGTVVSYPRIGDGYVSFVLAPTHIPGRIQVTWFLNGDRYEKVLYGDRVKVRGKGRIPPRFPDFDYRAYLARQGIFATFAVDTPDGVTRLGVGGNRLVRRGDSLRQRLLRRLDAVLPPEEAGLAHGLLFGDRSALSDSLSSAFRRTGLMHLLAVSGLHLGILLAGIWFLLRMCGLRPAVTYPLVGLVVGFALWVIGPRVSLVRAALLFAFLGLGSVLADLGLILRRWVNPFCALAAAGVVILALRPTELVSVGFQLSFGATAAILAAFSPGFTVTEWVDGVTSRLPGWTRPVGRYLLLLLITSAAAQAGTAPFLAYHFGTIYPLSLVGNLAAIPLATLALWTGLFTLILFPTPLFPLLGRLFAGILDGLIRVVERLAALPGASLPVPGWVGVWIGGMVVYFLLVAIYWRDRSSCTSYSTSITSSALTRFREGMK